MAGKTSDSPAGPTAMAVIFDFDGVLADTRQSAVKAYQQVLGKKGYPVAAWEVKRFWGRGAFYLVKKLFESRGVRKSGKEIESIAREKTRAQAEMISESKLCQGVKPLLRELGGKARMGVATSNRKLLVKAFLKHYGIGRFFKAVSTSEGSARNKPFPDQYLKASQMLKVKPRECVAVEDSDTGIQAAKRAGMRVIAVNTGFDSKSVLKKARPDLLVKSLNEKKRILEFLFRA